MPNMERTKASHERSEGSHKTRRGRDNEVTIAAKNTSQDSGLAPPSWRGATALNIKPKGSQHDTHHEEVLDTELENISPVHGGSSLQISGPKHGKVDKNSRLPCHCDTNFHI